ncbi:hypothetical protein GLW08_03455 [Pontibacillus yanchengensis]|uniref:Uncharacterized protein n=2 Tax=Pontibacillus yanchengensis TaxID=462910 RepID=A0ACC7VBR4_9BACI|nr:hypothetical protein [Pontibacillus yanchengensis]MYL35362.1 hypothetical protein [Pontibacillus yanchengensis]MYL52391.1 hypothetical protein [Pontibacillus yanchengensis]
MVQWIKNLLAKRNVIIYTTFDQSDYMRKYQHLLTKGIDVKVKVTDNSPNMDSQEVTVGEHFQMKQFDLKVPKQEAEEAKYFIGLG